jgi:signal transduction histidine kinase
MMVGLTLVLSILCIFIASIIRKIPKTELDIVAVNDIAKTVEEQWEFLNIQNGYNKSDNNTAYGFLNAMSDKYEMDFSLVDVEDKLLFTTREAITQNLNEAIKHRDTIVDITYKDKMIGKLIVYNEAGKILEDSRKNLIIISIGCCLLLFLWGASYLIYINKAVVKPFYHLKEFARSVAAGNLEMPLKMDRNNLFGPFSESFDIMREELNKSRENERRTNNSKKELVASLSHDIKTPVASIKAVSELMHIKAADEKQKKQIETIINKADQIDLLISNMFSATMEELKELKVEVTEEASTILQDIIYKADYEKRVKAITMSPCIIKCDKLRLQQVFDNIISNSYKYAGTDILITNEIIGHKLSITIKDFGNGVDKEQIPLLFEKYYRGDNAKGKNGSGLGLYLSRYFMEKMEGSISGMNLEDGFIITIVLSLA